MPHSELPEQVGPRTPAREAYVRGDSEVREESIVLREVADAAARRAEADPPCAVEPQLLAERDPPGGAALEARDRA